MKFSNVWAITMKEFSLFRRRTMILYTTFVIPFIIAIALPLIGGYALTIRKAGVSVSFYFHIFDAFSFWFLTIGAIIPTVIASYSFVGEKTEKTLEPLLATPATDEEILLGKSLAAFLPVVIMLWIAAFVFVLLFDWRTSALVMPVNNGKNYFPNPLFDVIILLNLPLVLIMSIELSIIISSRQNDVRSAQQLSFLAGGPFLVIYVLTETSILSVDTNTFLIIGAILAAIDIGLFIAAYGIFQREEILTKWK